MSLLLDKTGHFVGIQPNREDGLQINPHDFLLYSITIQMGRDRREMGLRGIPGFHPPVAPLPITGLFVVNLSRFACRPFFVDNRGMDELRELQATMRGCRICAEAGYDIVPGAVFQGRVGARAMIIGQAPGVTEVVAKRPFSARSLMAFLANFHKPVHPDHSHPGHERHVLLAANNNRNRPEPPAEC
jgi:hypothetical protein